MREPVLSRADSLQPGEPFCYFSVLPGDHRAYGPFTVHTKVTTVHVVLIHVHEDQRVREFSPDEPVEVMVDNPTIPGFTY